jgi:hypothetical protein
METEKIWKALSNLDKADIQTTALCHAIITLLIEKGVVTQEQTAEEMEKSIPMVLKLRNELETVTGDPISILNARKKTQTVQ